MLDRSPRQVLSNCSRACLSKHSHSGFGPVSGAGLGEPEAVYLQMRTLVLNNTLPTLCKLLDAVLLSSLYIQQCLTALEIFLILNPDPSFTQTSLRIPFTPSTLITPQP